MKENDYSDIWAMIGRLSVESDLEPKEIKESMVYNLTSGRTVRLSELSTPELGTLRKGLRKALGQGSDASGGARKDPSRARQRSRVLALLTKYGINTKDWEAINAFCLSPRIAGKAFAELTRDELTALAKKMHAILRKRGKQGDGETAPGDPSRMQVEPPRVEVKVSYRVYAPKNKTKSKRDKQYN